MFREAELKLWIYLNLYYGSLDNCTVVLEAFKQKTPLYEIIPLFPIFRKWNSLNPLQIQRSKEILDYFM